MTQEKKIRRFYWVLAAAVLFTVLITWLILTLTQPVLTDSAIHVWTITQTPAEYQDKININTATIDELTYAEGIGPSTAKNIYDYFDRGRHVVNYEISRYLTDHGLPLPEGETLIEEEA